MWSFNNWGIVPGALLMPQCVAASYRTVPLGFHTHSVQTHFLGNGTVMKRATYRVENLNDGKTFATRQVKVEQDGKTIVLTTVGFAKRASVAGRGAAVVEHAVPVVMPVDPPWNLDTSVGTPTLQSRDIRCQSLPKVCVRQDIFCANLSWLLQAPPQQPNQSSHDIGSAQMAPSQRKTVICKTSSASSPSPISSS